MPLIFASTYKNKEVLRKYTELWDGIKSQIKKMSDKPGDYDQKYMKIKFNSDDNSPLNEILKLIKLIRVVRSIFQEENKYYPQAFLDEL